MIYRKLDANGDYTFGQQSNDFLSNSPETVAQAVKTSLSLFRGEWFIDVTVGLSLPKILGFNNVINVDYEIQATILNVAGVTSIVTYNSYYAPVARSIIVQATINTAYGQTTISVNT